MIPMRKVELRVFPVSRSCHRNAAWVEINNFWDRPGFKRCWRNYPSVTWNVEISFKF